MRIHGDTGTRAGQGCSVGKEKKCWRNLDNEPRATARRHGKQAQEWNFPSVLERRKPWATSMLVVIRHRLTEREKRAALEQLTSSSPDRRGWCHMPTSSFLWAETFRHSSPLQFSLSDTTLHVIPLILGQLSSFSASYLSTSFSQNIPSNFSFLFLCHLSHSLSRVLLLPDNIEWCMSAPKDRSQWEIVCLTQVILFQLFLRMSVLDADSVNR